MVYSRAFCVWFFFSHFEAVQQSHLDFKGVFAGYLARQVSFFAIILLHLFVPFNFSLAYLAFYQAASIFIGTVVLYIYSRRYLLHRFNPSAAWIKTILHFWRIYFRLRYSCKYLFQC